MAKDYFDESKKKRKNKKRVVKKTQPSSASIKKSIQQSQERGAKRTAQTNVQAQQSYQNTRTTSVSGRGAASTAHRQAQHTPSQGYTERNNQKSYGTTRRASSPTSSNASRTRNTPATAAEMRRQQGQNQKSTAGITQEQQEKTKQRFSTAKEMMNARAEEGRKQKMGAEATEEQKEAINRAIRNTPSLLKKSAMDVGSGYLQSMMEASAMTASNKKGVKAKAMKMGIDPNKDKEQMREVERERRLFVKEAKEDNKKLHEAQKKRQEEFDKKTKGAKGLEKAYYGAVEAGTGMLADIGIGAVTGTGQVGALGSMYMRTFGPSTNHARDEGATDKEARKYGFWQANKEVGTELMFPGAGLARRAYGRAGIPLAERAANRLLRGLSGRAADVTHAGLRLGLGMGEENLEEGAGWLLDPVIKEYTYGKNVRKREAKKVMNSISEDMRSKIADENDAASVSAYLSSDTFLEDTKRDYMEDGLSEEEAEVVANKMRDFLTASLTGDTETMERLEDEISTDVANAHNVLKDYSKKELFETIASTSLLTGVAGLPGSVTTASRGAAIRDELGDEGIRALARTAIDFENARDSFRGQAARDRLDSGRELTSTQVFELAQAAQNQIVRDSRRQEASVDNASRQIRSEDLVSPYGVNADGEMVLDETTNNNYESTARAAETTIKNFVDNSEEKESLTEDEIRDGSRAIAGFKTGIFTIDDANELNYSNTAVRDAFKEETGIDLSQFIVRDRDGHIDIPQTNAATKDALFAMASDNLVESAREATANWMDNVKGEVVSQVTARMGAEGSLALQSALDDVDERNRSEYMMVANASDMMYHRGRNMGVDWEDVKSTAIKMFPHIDPSKLETMYNAGLRDREKANYEYEGKVAKLGRAIEAANALEDSDRANVSGKVIIDTKTPPKGTVVRLFSELANNLGVDIRLVDEIIDEKTGEVVERANGTYYKGVITINVTSGVEQNLGYIFMHEVTHHLKRYAPKEWQALENFVRERWNSYNPDHMQNEIARIMQTYSGQQTLTEEQALEEIIADAAHEFLNDPNFANEVAEDNPSLAKAILESIRNALRMLRRILSTGSIDDETHMNSLFSQLGILDETERLWLSAYRTAVANKAALAIDNWQDDVNAQSGSTERLSLSDSNLTVQGNTARWTDSRIDSLIRENGASDERYSKAWAAMMSPRDFLKLTIDDGTLEKWMQDENETRPLDEENLRGEGQTPFLIIDDTETVDPATDFSHRVTGHEGRHRMIALMNAGIESVPVAIRGTEATKYKKTSIPELTLAAQDYYGEGGVNNEARVNALDLVPIKESNRDELIEKFGGEADVRFSISEQQDADYMKAVESGDMETAQRMVDEAAKVAGYDYDGWHGTDADFTEFSPSYISSDNKSGIGFYFAMDGLAFEYKNKIKAKIKLNSPIIANYKNSSKDISERTWKKFAEEIGVKYEDIKGNSDVDTYVKASDINKISKDEFLRKIRDITGKDGIISYERNSYISFSPENIKDASPVTYDDDGNVIPLSERFNQENPDIRFSISAPVERVRDLVAVHNLNEEDLRGDFGLGGFPMPSIAVTKSDVGHDRYGAISLLFHSDTIDPEANRNNQIFGGDAWTPTFPPISKKYNTSVLNNIDKTLHDIIGLSSSNELPGDMRFPSLDESNVANKLDYHTPYEAYGRDEVFRLAYIMSQKGYNGFIPTKESELYGENRNTWEIIDERLPEITYDDIYDTVDHTMQYEPALRKALYDSMMVKDGELSEETRKKIADHLYKDELPYNKTMRYLENLIKFRKEGIPDTVDREAFDKILNEQVDEEGFKSWIDGLFEGYVEKTGMRNDKDMFTPSGKRRSWESLHDPVTLDNVVSIMKNELDAGGTTLFGANPKGAAQKKYNSLDDVRADEDRLQSVSEEEFEAMSDSAMNKLSDVCQSIVEHNPKIFGAGAIGASLDVGSDIAEVLNRTKNRNRMQQLLKKDYWLDVNDEEMDSLMEAIEEIANLPTEYFEAKPRRAVGFNEVKAAIVPEDTSEDILNELELMEIPVTKYNKEVEGDRAAKLNEVADAEQLKFSLSPEQRKLASDAEGTALSNGQIEFFEQSKVRNEAGQLKVMLHGTDADFTEFDPSKARPGTLGRAFYFSDSDAHAGQYGNVGRYYLNLEHPLMGETHDITKDQLRKFVAYLADNEDYGIENYGADATVDSVTDSVWGGTDFAMLRDLNLSAVGDFAEAVKAFNRVNDTDYDGIITDVETAAFYPEQIKRTDNLNPTLSKDTRYSITDSENRELSDDQVKYFRDSQARDEQGRLVPVFHTTNRGGFTVFDPSKSDDRRSIFFASNFDVSQTYGKHSNARIYPFDISSNDDFRKYINSTQGVYFAVLTNEEWEEAKAKGASLEAIKGSTGVHEFQFNMAQREGEAYKWSQYKKSHPNANLNGYEFDNYLEAVQSGEINPDDYMLVVSVPNTTGSIAWDNDYINARSAEELGLEVDKRLRSARNLYATGMRDVGMHGYYECYLNLENPLIIDARGANWNAIPYGEERNLDNHLIELENKSNLMISSIMVTQEDFNDDGNPTRMDISIRYEVKVDGKWSTEVFNHEESIAVSPNEFEDSDDPAYLPWKKAEEALKNFGLPEGYINELEMNHLDYDGDIFRDFKTDDRVQFDYINTQTGEFEIVDPYEYDSQETYRTRELAEMAQDQGYDGVIIKNCYDIGGASKLKGFDAVSDIYIAFSSNQVKDINNENPTENPDIRFSIAPEDETVSRMAYEAAEDDSVAILEYYEQRLANLTDEEAENIAIRDYDEDDAALFYSALRSEEPVPYEDYVLEEDRIRMARSKDDFFSNVNAKWNDRWITEGEVLDVKSVKNDVRNLIMGVMQNSDTDSKYKRTLVNKTLMDVRYAYEFFKKDRPELASALLYHSAQRMINNVQFYVDGTFDQYKELKHYLRNTKISIGEEYWSDVDYDSFRKRNYNRINLVKGKTNVDQVYQELEEMFPEFFNEEEVSSVPDQLLQIEHVLDTVQPYKEAYSSEEAADLAFDIADDLYEIMVNGNEVRSLADTYKERYETKTKAMKQRHAEAMLRVRRARDIGIEKERQKFREYKEKQKEKKLHAKHFERINKNYKWLKERLLTNTKDKHIPEQYKRDLAGLLAAFDLQTVGSKNLEAKRGYQSQKTIQMSAIRTGLQAMHDAYPTFFVHDAITDKIDALAKEVDGKTIDALSVEQLSEIDDILKGLKSDFINYEKIMVKGKQRAAADAGKAQTRIALEHAEQFGPGRDYQNALGAIDRLINLDEMTAPYLFRRIDPNKEGLGMMYGEIRRAFNKYVRNLDELNGWMEDIVGKYHRRGILWNRYGSGELTNWRSDNYAVTFNFDGGSARLTPAQMMSIYCLAKRPQAQKHMYSDVGGIVVAPVTFNARILSDVRRRANKALPVRLTESDVQQIIAQLTPEQIQVADQLQELMSTKMAEWGNEASMDVMGIELFKEDNYFPIKSDKASLPQELTDDQFIQAIRNFGFAKALLPEPKNPIMVEDIFDVVTAHCNNMNLYNSYSKAFDDFMKVYNYKDYGDGGSNYTVQQAVAHAYSEKATTFIMTFLRDLNGNVSGRASGIEDAYNNLLGNAKRAAVFANLRVAAQQPTAITRALYVIDLKYASGIKIEKGAMKEMFEHCPIALWKFWGNYDINMGKSIEDIMMNNGRWLEDAATNLYGALDNVTWTAIWQMVKAEMNDTHPNVEIGSDEYWELCDERMSEIVDLTQVVDSPLHRSHAMRSKNPFTKAATAFMAEPTLTFNMIKEGWVRAREAEILGNNGEATRIIGRTIAVALLQATTVAGAAGLIDALRKKHPDKDDEDERILHLWLVNFIENFKGELKLWNKVYFVKDIASQFEGWDNANLALQGFQKFSLGLRQLSGDPYARSSASWYENIADGLGYMFGVPVKTMRTGIKNAMDLLGVTSPIVEATKERLDAAADNNKSKKGKNSAASKAVDDDFQVEGKGLFGMLLAKADENDDKSDKKSKGKSKTNSQMTHEEERDKLRDLEAQARANVEGLSGRERDEVLWDTLSEGYTKHLENGDLDYIEHLALIYRNCGGDENVFREKIKAKIGSAYKKTFKDNPTDEDLYAQDRMRHYMEERLGFKEEEISAIVYKTDTARDLKVAFRLNNEEYINTELALLARAGITLEDVEKLYKNRNRIKLETYNGKYKDMLKSTGKYLFPAEGIITSDFGNRASPGGIGSTNHQGLDIAGARGTPIQAADGGIVIKAGWYGGYGKTVQIQHDDGTVTQYSHLDWWDVNEGDTVVQGQEVGLMGSTGDSTGPHLHFGVIKNGEYVDPKEYINTNDKEWNLDA